MINYAEFDPRDPLSLQRERWALQELRRRLLMEGHRLVLTSRIAEPQFGDATRPMVRELTDMILNDLYPGGPWIRDDKTVTVTAADPEKMKADYTQYFGDLDGPKNVAELERMTLKLKPKGQNRLLS